MNDHEHQEQTFSLPPHLANRLEAERVAQEKKQLRRLQMMMNMCMQVIAQDGH